MTIANFSKVDVHLLKYQKVGEVANAPVKIVHIRDEPYPHITNAMRITVTAQSTLYTISPPRLFGTNVGTRDCQEEAKRNP